jgi:hypothetical protein
MLLHQYASRRERSVANLEVRLMSEVNSCVFAGKQGMNVESGIIIISLVMDLNIP